MRSVFCFHFSMARRGEVSLIKAFQEQGLLESGKRGLLSTFQWPFRETEVGLVPLPMLYQ